MERALHTASHTWWWWCLCGIYLAFVSVHVHISCMHTFNSLFLSSVLSNRDLFTHWVNRWYLLYATSQAISCTGCIQELVIVVALSQKTHSSIGRCNMYIDIDNATWKKIDAAACYCGSPEVSASSPGRGRGWGQQEWRWAGHKHQLGKTLEGKCFWCWALKDGQNLEIWRLAQPWVSC